MIKAIVNKNIIRLGDMKYVTMGKDHVDSREEIEIIFVTRKVIKKTKNAIRAI